MATKKAILIPWEMDKDVQVIGLPDGIGAIYEHVAPDSRMFDVKNFPAFTLMFDDEGLYTQPDNVNLRAMALWAVMENARIGDFAVPLVGNYLVVGKPDRNGNNTDVTDGTVLLVSDIAEAVASGIAKARTEEN